MHLTFIINPISGSGKAARLVPFIKHSAEKLGLDVDILLTKYSGHAFELSRELSKDPANIVVAVGGDGTVNEVARGLIGSDATLAIIPCGSGNGLARHLKISMRPKKAISAILEKVANHTASIKRIDTCVINGRAFFCTAGVGFDAQVGYAFSKGNGRGLVNYVRYVLREYKTFVPETYSIDVEGESGKISIQLPAFLITFANANQWGNNAIIAPKASLEDGLIDIEVMKPFSLLEALRILFEIMTGRIDRDPKVLSIRGKKVAISRSLSGVAHFDGEPCEFGSEVTVEVKPHSLNVFC